MSVVCAFLSPKTTWPCVWRNGATPETLTASRAMARPSASVSRPTPLLRAPDAWTGCGHTKRPLAAKLSISPPIWSDVLVPSAVTMTTAVMPMKIPSTVSAARVRLRAIAPSASRRAPSHTLTPAASARTAS